MDEESCLSVARKFLLDKGCSGTVLFCMVGGSRAYNLATELSDIDYVGVYSFDTSTVLSMSKPARVPSAPLSTLPNSDGPDVTLYEVKQYLLQLCKGNPFCMEMLFTDRLCWMSEPWKSLRSWRRDVLSRDSVDEYVAYVQHRLAEHRVKPKLGKRIYHAVRLLRDAERMVGGLEPQIYLSDGSHRDYLILIRSQSDPSPCAVEDTCARLVSTISEKMAHCSLPQSARKDRINAWLVRLRLNSETSL